MCNNNTSAGGVVQSGRVHRHRKDIENEEIQMYLSKLKELVPFMPKNRKLSKLEVIQYVIDYICDLQYALETHPTVNSAVVQASAAAMMRQSSPTTGSAAVQTSPRQPLGVLAPNTILSPAPATCASQDLTNSTTSSHLTTTDKIGSEADSRSVSSC